MRIFIVDFDSATPSAANSIRQRELLNGWLALYARRQSLPQLVDYHPERLEDTLPRPRLRLIIDRELRHRPPGRILSGDLIEFS